MLLALNRRIEVVVMTVVLATILAPTSQAAKFNVIDRTLIAEYHALGRDRVPLIIAAQPKQIQNVARAISLLGGEIVSRRDDIGFLYVRLKVSNIGEVQNIQGIDALEVAAGGNRSEANVQGNLDANQKEVARPPDASLELDNPYTAEYATQASDFKSKYPTFDGRGVVIGFVEAADPSLPSMKGALDLIGNPLPKFSLFSWGNPSRARNTYEASSGRFWQRTEQVFKDVNGRFLFRGRSYTFPSDISEQEWRVCARGFSPQSKSTSTPGEILLWAVGNNRIWILQESQKDFHRAPSLKLVRGSGFQTLRDDDRQRTAEPYRSWILNVDYERRLIAFGQPKSHAEMVASVIAGTRFLGSHSGGIAPASQLAVFREEDYEDNPGLSEIENVFNAIINPDVDVVTSSVDTSDTARGPEPTVHSILINRLVRLTRKPLVLALGNHGPWLGSVRGFRGAENVFSIGGYTPVETLRANLGVIPSSDYPTVEYSGWGPAEDGGLKPDFLALTQTLSEYTSLPVASAYEKPLGLYGVSGGTSAAAPNAAGHLALLMSAAKQKGIKHDPLRLRAAIATTAKFLPGIEARAQGHGLIQIADAWNALQRANNWEPPTFVTSARVIDRENKHQMGRGIFEMSGWRPRMTGVRYITLNRITGGAGNKVYRLKWKDNSEAFSCPLKDIVVPLGRPVRLPVQIKVKQSGTYSAILELIDLSSDLVAHSISATVIVAESLNSNDRVVLKESLPRPGNAIAFINVPAGLSMLRVRVARADGISDVSANGLDNWTLTAQDPTGRRLPFSLYGAPLVDEKKGASVNGERVQVFANPVAGVWQFAIQVRGFWLHPSVDKLKATDLSWEVQGYRVAAKESTEKGVARFVNDGTFPIRGKVSALGLGSQRDVLVTLQRGLSARQFELMVPDGAKRLEVLLSKEERVGHIGLYIYKVPVGPNDLLGDPTSVEPTALVYYDASFVASKNWTLESPKPGKYVVAIDPLDVPEAGLKVHYSDIILYPLYGELYSEDQDSVMVPLAEKLGKLNWKIASRPTGDRKLVAVGAFTSSGVGYSKPADDQKLTIVPVPLATKSIVLDLAAPR